MKRLLKGLSLLLLGVLLQAPIAAAASPVVISQLSTGNTQSANNEFVELYNNSDADVEITHWCIRYTTATGDAMQSTPKYCFTPSDVQTKLYLTARHFAFVATPTFVVPVGFMADGIFTGTGMAAGGGHIKLIDAHEAQIDKLGWGSALFGEGYMTANPAPIAPSTSQSLSRKVISAGALRDTDDNRADFELVTPALHSGGVYEERTAIDLCGNLTGIQETLPAGYGYDEAGNCELIAHDVCGNIEKIQLTLPEGMRVDNEKNCTILPPDACPNLDNYQSSVPLGYVIVADSCIQLETRELWLSELLANASGADAGQEFIEIYNPHGTAITLSGYSLLIGKNFEKTYALPPKHGHATIEPHSYIAYTDDELGFNLLNSTSGVRVIAPAGNIVSEVSYSDPKDDMAWALIDGVWQYSDQPTPGTSNMGNREEEVLGISGGLASCPAGKYRHPLTNRCRNVEADTAVLADCLEGYYRNPDTNRCRKLATAATELAPCQTGYSRNPTTNRCRKDSANSSGLAPCKAGQERNPVTNRCRTVGSPLATPAASVASAPSTPVSSATSWAIGLAGAGIVGYGVYEWRNEIAGTLRRALGSLGKK